MLVSKYDPGKDIENHRSMAAHHVPAKIFALIIHKHNHFQINGKLNHKLASWLLSEERGAQKFDFIHTVSRNKGIRVCRWIQLIYIDFIHHAYNTVSH